jgi:gamma-glutamylcyclotransferase
VPKVWVFFYGSYMNRDVLGEVGIRLEEVEVARVAGWDIMIKPRANLVPSETSAVHGILTRATHDELTKLYAHAKDVLGEVYLPEAVIAETRLGSFRAALCYVAATMEPQPPDAAYVDRIIDGACEHGLPADYVARLEAFRPVPRPV